MDDPLIFIPNAETMVNKITYTFTETQTTKTLLIKTKSKHEKYAIKNEIELNILQIDIISEKYGYKPSNKRSSL